VIRAVLPRQDGGVTVLIGLSADNVFRMTEGAPVRATLHDLKLPRMPHDVVIVYGATEADILAQLRKAGVDLPASAFDAAANHQPGTRIEYDGASKTVEVHPHPNTDQNTERNN
jgi:hypothetical protein